MYLQLFKYAIFAGIPMFIGGLLARLIRLPNHKYQEELCHTVVAIGGGILSASVAFVLIPHSISILPPLTTAIFFLLGGLCFAYLESVLAKSGGSK